MKPHTTNYFNTFIEIADDCPISNGEIPPTKVETKTVANIQFEMVSKNPYKFTSDDIIFQVFANKIDLTKNEYKEAREQFFSKGQACFRASPLTKRYGWGVHYDKEGKMAIYGADSPEYEKFSKDKTLKIIKAMKSKNKMTGKIEYQFTATVWQYASPKGGWYFVSLPTDISKEIRELFKWQEEGWGRLKATAKVNDTKWDTAIWFDTNLETYLLPLKAEIRKKEKLEKDKTINIIIWI